MGEGLASTLFGLPLYPGFPFVWASPRGEAVRFCGLLRGISLHLPLIRRLRDTFSHGRRLEFRSHLQGEGLFAVLPVLASPRGEAVRFCGLLRGTSLHLPLIRRLRDTFSQGEGFLFDVLYK